MDYLENDLNMEGMPDGVFPETLEEIKDEDVSAPVDGADFPQTDSEEESSEDAQEKPKRKSRKKKEETPDPADEGFPDDDPAFTVSGEDDSEDGALPEDTASADVDEPERRRRSSGRSAVLDSAGNVIVERTDSGQHDLSVLTAARNARRVLTATVDAIETDGEALPRVVFYMGTVKVMIPFSQMGFDLDPEEVSQREAGLLIDSMLGAKIDFMVRGVDTEARIAAGSRRDAMLMRQRTILNARRAGNESEYRINEGMRVSMKAAEDAPQLALRDGNTYTGHISNFSATAYYVRVVGIPVEVRCPIKSNHSMELMGPGDFVKFYVRGIYDGIPTGAILKVLKKKTAPGL